MIEATKNLESEYGIKITFSIENEPLGTAGPLILARKLLLEDDKPFFMLNSDVSCEFPLQEMIKYHKRHGREGTILVTPVENPSKYGLVVFKEDGQISEFLEKPQHETKELPSNHINAGIYLLNKSVLDMLPENPTNVSIERQIFPQMTVKNNLYAMPLQGYWMDIGQPADYLTGTKLHLKALWGENPELFATSESIKGKVTGNVLIHPTAKVGQNCHLGPDVVIGPNCVVGDGVRLTHTTLMEGTVVESFAYVANSIIGWRSKIRSWAHLKDCLLGEDVEADNGIVLIGATVCPHRGVKESSLVPKVIL